MEGRTKSSGFKMKKGPMKRNFGIVSPVKEEKDKVTKVRQEATGPEGGGGIVIKNPAMISLEENKPPVDSPSFAAWNVAYQKAVERNKADNAPK